MPVQASLVVTCYRIIRSSQAFFLLNCLVRWTNRFGSTYDCVGPCTTKWMTFLNPTDCT